MTSTTHNIQHTTYNKGSPRKNAPHEREAVNLRREVSSVRGQSLFEVILSLAIATLIITALVSLAANAVRNSSYSKNKSQATRYAQEATEWLRGERDKDWTTVYDKSAINNPICGIEYPSCYCFKVLSWTGSTTGKCADGQEIAGTIFKREIYFNRSLIEIPADSGVFKTILGMMVKVYWTDAQGLHEVRSATSFTDWRQI